MSKKSTKSADQQILNDLNVTIEAVLGETNITVGEFKSLEKNSTIALDAQLNELVELRINGQIIARGELVNVDDKFGVKITQLSDE